LDYPAADKVSAKKGRHHAEQRKGLFTYRASNRSGNYLDYRGDRHPEPVAFEDGVQ
jgi:hypothetical protein